MNLINHSLATNTTSIVFSRTVRVDLGCWLHHRLLHHRLLHHTWLLLHHSWLLLHHAWLLLHHTWLLLHHTGLCHHAWLHWRLLHSWLLHHTGLLHAWLAVLGSSLVASWRDLAIVVDDVDMSVAFVVMVSQVVHELCLSTTALGLGNTAANADE